MKKIVLGNEMIELTEEEFLEFEKNLGYEPIELSYKEQIINKIRNKYSVDDELAILRQRDSKPEEFAEYFDFVEKIKHQLKEAGNN